MRKIKIIIYSNTAISDIVSIYCSRKISIYLMAGRFLRYTLLYISLTLDYLMRNISLSFFPLSMRFPSCNWWRCLDDIIFACLDLNIRFCEFIMCLMQAMFDIFRLFIPINLGENKQIVCRLLIPTVFADLSVFEHFNWILHGIVFYNLAG